MGVGRAPPRGGVTESLPASSVFRGNANLLAAGAAGRGKVCARLSPGSCTHPNSVRGDLGSRAPELGEGVAGRVPGVRESRPLASSAP